MADNYFQTLAKMLMEKGYKVVLFDFTGHGESEGNDYDVTLSKSIKDLEKEYVDGIILIGEDVNRLFESYENSNHIPTISVYKQNQLLALKKLYPLSLLIELTPFVNLIG